MEHSHWPAAAPRLEKWEEMARDFIREYRETSPTAILAFLASAHKQGQHGADIVRVALDEYTKEQSA